MSIIQLGIVLNIRIIYQKNLLKLIYLNTNVALFLFGSIFDCDWKSPGTISTTSFKRAS